MGEPDIVLVGAIEDEALINSMGKLDALHSSKQVGVLEICSSGMYLTSLHDTILQLTSQL